jgi:hypothetical protein
VPNCYKCGGPAEVQVEDGSAVCDRCEGEYQSFLEATYPFGQCYQCGAEYHPWTCQFGSVHVVATHAEGQCGGWRDSGPPDDQQCSEGCYQPGLWTGMEMAMLTLPPVSATVFTYTVAPAFNYDDDDLDDTLPF